MTHGTLLVDQGKLLGTLYKSKVIYIENKKLPDPEVLMNLLELSFIPLLLTILIKRYSVNFRFAINFRQVFFIIF
jgi:hypothetical protein